MFSARFNRRVTLFQIRASASVTDFNAKGGEITQPQDVMICGLNLSIEFLASVATGMLNSP